MTATDELRRLLDERGVEWIGTIFSTPTKGHPTNTSLGEEHHEATFIEYDDGNVLRLFDLTPAQAVEATLGRGTCNADETDMWECVRDDLGGYGKTLTVHVMECTECGHTYEHVNGSYEFCPRCGRKVVDV